MFSIGEKRNRLPSLLRDHSIEHGWHTYLGDRAAHGAQSRSYPDVLGSSSPVQIAQIWRIDAASAGGNRADALRRQPFSVLNDQCSLHGGPSAQIERLAAHRGNSTSLSRRFIEKLLQGIVGNAADRRLSEHR